MTADNSGKRLRVTRILRWRLACACLIGLGLCVSGYLLYRTFALLGDGGPGKADACSALFGTGCDAALLSATAWQMGLPLAGWGVVYFATLAGLLILGWTLGESFETEASTAALMFSLGGGFVSVYLLAILAAGRSPLCPLCIVTHAINLLLIPSLKQLNGQSVREICAALRAGIRYLLGRVDGSPTGSWKLLGFVTATMVAVIVYQWVYVEAQLRRSAAYNTAAAVKVLEEYSTARLVTIPRRESDPRLGPRSAPVRMVVFSDFQCSGCRRLSETLRPLLRKFDDKLEIVFKHFPLSSRCNPHIKGDIHPMACAAARAAAAAHMQGRFWEFHDALFHQFGNLNDAQLRQIARESGLDVARFDADRQAETTADAMQADIELGVRIGVNATPTVFIDGRPVVRTSRAALALVIYHELSAAMQRRVLRRPIQAKPPQ